jgi:hypothetical protein
VTAPSVRARLAVAAAIATAASVPPYIERFRTPGHPGDFGIVWFGAKALLHGANPYALVGPGRVYDWPWHQLYPATAMVVGMPFALLPQLPAIVAFVWISTALLAWGITADGWYRLPLFLSSTFLIAAWAAQWSPLLTAALCIPSLAWIFAAKPNLGLALLASATRVQTIRVALVGGAALAVISLVIYPGWPLEWLAALRTASYIHSPILLPGGLFVLLALLKWRRPEARLIVALACVPQTNSWYEALPLLLIPATYRESLLLSLVSSLGMLFQWQFMTANSEIEFNRTVGILMIAFVYLPATLLVLLRPNRGELPPWLERVFARRSEGMRVAAEPPSLTML